MAIIVSVLLGFLISLVISGIIIYLASKFLGETEGFGTAIAAAFSGALISALASYFLRPGPVAALIGGVAWLIALGSLYKIGWLKALAIAVVIWVFTAIAGLLLPALAPL